MDTVNPIICAGCDLDLHEHGIGSLTTFEPTAGGTSYIYPFCRVCHEAEEFMTNAQRRAFNDSASLRVERAPARYGAIAVPEGQDIYALAARYAKDMKEAGRKNVH